MVKLHEHFSDNQVQYFSITLLVFFLFICFMPFNCFQKKGRKQLARTLGHIFISPFGKVRFRHFFLADVITSLTSPLQHVLIIECYYQNKHFIDAGSVKLDDECPVANGFFWAMAFLPYWWRMMQCFRKYYDSNWELTIQFWNAMKYFSCLVTPTVLYFLTSASGTGIKYDTDWLFWLFMFCKFFQTTYCFIWDIYVDWGLFR